MSRRPKELRSWPEREGEDALNALREGLARLRSGVAVFREMVQTQPPQGPGSETSEDRA